VVTSAAGPYVFWVGEHPRVLELRRAWPVGDALAELLAGVNPEVCEARADERARLGEHGYGRDLPQPALWWPPAAA
jgi:hypothetical protein